LIIDLNAANEPLELACDVCLVGSGAAGLAIASELSATTLKVLLVESGGLELEPQTQALYDVDICGLPHPGSTQGRFRVCGGSTTKWAGQALPLMSSDFERRDWVAHSGWPISFDDLRSYYERACRFLAVDEMNFDTDLFAALRVRPPAFNPRRVWYHFSKWSPEPRVRERYLPGIAGSDRCTLLLHANLSNIVLGDGLNRTEAIELRSLAGRQATVRARTFVLCVGGIETARVLLANNRQQTKGIGNQHDLVGRYFQDHIYAEFGWLKPVKPARTLRTLNVFHRRGLTYRVRCTAAPQWQRENRTLNASMGIVFFGDPVLTDIYRGIRSRRVGTAELRQMCRMLARPHVPFSTVWQRAVRGRTFVPGTRLRFCLTCEQEPDPESRILLADTTDALGIRRATVQWRLTELVQYTMQRFAAVLDEEFRRAGLGEIDLDPWFRDGSLAWTANSSLWGDELHLRDQFHHIGTTRMNDSSCQGVVDRDCRVHGIANLYIGGSAVFPTSGHSNPTLTIIALCMRLADHLKHELA
jgi:choline dehydrogenase-like flavoprotein